MKSLSLGLTFILIIFSIALPASFRDMSVFGSQDTISLSDVVESEDERSESDPDDDQTSIELIEEEVIHTNSQFRIFAQGQVFDNFEYRKVYISSYINSIYVPPLV